MQKRFLKLRFTFFGAWFFVVLSIVAPILSAQSQNPFDIKSRKYIDTTNQPEIELPNATSGAFNQDSQLSFQEGPDSILDHNVFAPSIGHEDTSLISSDLREPVVRDTPFMTESISSPSSPTIKKQTSPPLSKIKSLADDVTLSGQSEQTLSWWYYVFDIILLLILLGAFLYDKNIFSPLRKAFVHENFLRFLYRDTYLRKPGLFIYLNVLFLLSLGFIIFRTAMYFGWASTFRDYLIIQCLVLFLFLLKHFSLHFLSRLVDKPFDLKFYQYWMILSAGLIGLWLIPLALMISVLPHQYLAIALIIISIPVVLLLIYRQSKAMLHAKFFLSKHFFQIFLYFCAVEIVPVVLLVDILVHY